MSTDTHDKDAEIQALRAALAKAHGDIGDLQNENRSLRAIIQGNKEALRKAMAKLVQQSEEIAHQRDEIQMLREMLADTMHELMIAQRQAPASME
jgi:peptidoglycan hydrolase CwlO-like protein